MSLVALIGIALACLLIFSGLVKTREPGLRVWFFDIGQGDAALIETPGGKQILIDGGPDDRLLAKLGAVMAPWDRKIDMMIETHADADHVTGFVSVLERYRVQHLVSTGRVAHTQIGNALVEAVASEGAEKIFASVGTRWEVDGVQFDVLWPKEVALGVVPEEPNRSALVIRVTYGDTSILFTADINAEEELALVSAVGDIDVLKVAHHGSRTSSDPDFLDRVQPEVMVISAGEHNLYGHPHPVILDRLQRRGRVLRTDRDGDIFLFSNGGEPYIAPAPLPF